MAENKKTVVMGASENPARYSRKAVEMLRRYGHDVVAIGLREGKIGDVRIMKGPQEVANTDTVTMYLSAKNQGQYYEYILALRPKRIIYNPGAENDELERMAEEKGIENVEACTLVMLSTGQY